MKRFLLILLASLLLAGCSGGNAVPEKRAPPARPESAGSGKATVSHRCGHPTRKGTPCKRKVAGTAGYCWQHNN